MITSVTIRKFKNIEEQKYDFTDFDLLVGRNNSGKSTVLQALAIWQFCIDEFYRRKRKGSTGAQIVLPNFTALPLPEFNLLWKDKTERRYTDIDGKKKKQEFIYIEIIVEWKIQTGSSEIFGIKLRYHTPQSVYATPIDGWKRFNEISQKQIFPRIVYVPPFSGLETNEKWVDSSIIKQQIGKAQPGSVLRNLLYHIIDGKEKPAEESRWKEVNELIKRLFSVEIKVPRYEKGVDTYIVCEYKAASSKGGYDIIAGGSGFHQVLTILAFIYGYTEQITTILFDEPDAHMHVNLQREILEYLKKIGTQKDIQFIIATHAEEFIRRVDVYSVISLLQETKNHSVPKRIKTTHNVITALADISNIDITQALESPFILYVEGETDLILLSQWAAQLDKMEIYNKFITIAMKGGSKKEKKEFADRHFQGLKQIVPSIERIMVFDYDSDKDSFHPDEANPALFEWKRKNIENYLLVSDAWIRAAKNMARNRIGEISIEPITDIITNFFTNENLTLPNELSWKELNANIFKNVDGKILLFEDKDSLFQKLRNFNEYLVINRQSIASTMLITEIHKDIDMLFELMALKIIESYKNQMQETQSDITINIPKQI